MRSWFSRLSPILLLTLAGCASAPAPVAPSIDVLEQNLMDAFEVRADYLIPDAITASRSRYEAFDDLAGQWRVTRLAALFALAHGHAVRAEAEALHLDVLRGQLAVEQTLGLRIDFETDIVLGRALGDDSALQRVVAESGVPLDRAIALAYLGDTARALEVAGQGSDRAADRAFIHYRYGRDAGDAGQIERALELFRQTGDSRGIADSLFALAQLEANEGDRDRAVSLAVRARRALMAIGESTRADAIAAWLSRQ